jgi:hypothetical protein
MTEDTTPHDVSQNYKRNGYALVVLALVMSVLIIGMLGAVFVKFLHEPDTRPDVPWDSVIGLAATCVGLLSLAFMAFKDLYSDRAVHLYKNCQTPKRFCAETFTALRPEMKVSAVMFLVLAFPQALLS